MTLREDTSVPVLASRVLRNAASHRPGRAVALAEPHGPEKR